MTFSQVLAGLAHNRVLWSAGGAWLLAQIIKVPIDRARTGHTNWSLLISTGGMPSSHSTLVCALATAVGIQDGFDSAAFALAVILAAVVSYDAAGIRRAAGRHANVINQLIEELSHGHPLRDEQMKEILGHSPGEVLGGAFFGVITGGLLMLFWPK